MPLDAQDIEKIETIIERASRRIENDISQLMPRIEYEKAHIELYNRTIKNEQSINEVVKWAMSEHEKIAKNTQDRFDKLEGFIKEVGTQVDGVKADISGGRVTTIRYIVTVIVSVGVGIALPLLLKYLGG